VIEQACDLYNAGLEHRKRMWRDHGQSVGFYDQSAELREVRAEGATCSLKLSARMGPSCVNSGEKKLVLLPEKPPALAGGAITTLRLFNHNELL
jgi:hypothetical protein